MPSLKDASIACCLTVLGKVKDLWKKLVHDQVYKAIHRFHPVLKAHNAMDQVFRFQDLDALVDKLEGSDGGTEHKQHKKD